MADLARIEAPVLAISVPVPDGSPSLQNGIATPVSEQNADGTLLLQISNLLGLAD